MVDCQHIKMICSICLGLHAVQVAQKAQRVAHLATRDACASTSLHMLLRTLHVISYKHISDLSLSGLLVRTKMSCFTYTSINNKYCMLSSPLHGCLRQCLHYHTCVIYIHCFVHKLSYFLNCTCTNFLFYHAVSEIRNHTNEDWSLYPVPQTTRSQHLPILRSINYTIKTQLKHNKKI